MTDGKKPETPKFEYLLNALENAAMSTSPALRGYAGHRAKALDYVAKLEADLIAAQKELERANKGYEAASLEITMTGLDVGRALTGARLLYSTDIGLRVEALRERVEKAEQALALRGEPVMWAVTHNGEFTLNVFTHEGNAVSAKRTLDIRHPKDKREIVPLYAAPISDERAGTIGHVSHNRPAADALAAVSGERVREALTDKELIDAWNSARVPDGHLPDGIGLVEQYLRHMRAVAEAQINKSALPLAAIQGEQE